MTCVYIDPGIHCSGLAVFDRCKRLIRLECLRAGSLVDAVRIVERMTAILATCGSASRCVIELPQNYSAGSKADANDLISLGAVAGAYASAASQLGYMIDFVRPAQWKRQTPKHITHERAIAKLSEREIALVTGLDRFPRSTRHNALDALALGLWDMGLHGGET